MSNPHITETDTLSCVELSFCQSERAFSDLLYCRMTSSALCALLRDERMDDGGMERHGEVEGLWQYLWCHERQLNSTALLLPAWSNDVTATQ